ncbi:MAG: bifunctional phosphoglucose/phosphomannose isomerase [Actinomycetota bacterium]|nr:bifunctional phosphoglucose/phosphomannose isomerase [Actinomycetota bacterium]
MNLDRPERYGAVDRQDALGDIEASADQWAHARQLALGALDLRAVDAVVVAGMGGSGLTGDIVAALAADRLEIPVVVHKGYGLPGFVGRRTLVIAVSYSGRTEETRSAVEAALRRGARLFAVSGGGDIAARCDQAGVPRVAIPALAGRQPRHSLGYLAVPTLVALGLDDGLDEAIAVQHALGAELHRDVPTASNPAKLLGCRLADGGVPVLWGARGLGAVAAYRLKCQLNENAKLPALWAELPELTHNEVVAWQEHTPLTGASGLALLRDPEGEHPREQARFTLVERLIAERLAWRQEITARGRSPLARLASLLLVADLASVYAALRLDRDPTPIPPIDRIKAEFPR